MDNINIDSECTVINYFPISFDVILSLRVTKFFFSQILTDAP